MLARNESFGMVVDSGDDTIYVVMNVASRWDSAYYVAWNSPFGDEDSVLDIFEEVD